MKCTSADPSKTFSCELCKNGMHPSNCSTLIGSGVASSFAYLCAQGWSHWQGCPRGHLQIPLTASNAPFQLLQSLGMPPLLRSTSAARASSCPAPCQQLKQDFQNQQQQQQLHSMLRWIVKSVGVTRVSRSLQQVGYCDQPMTWSPRHLYNFHLEAEAELQILNPDL